MFIQINQNVIAPCDTSILTYLHVYNVQIVSLYSISTAPNGHLATFTLPFHARYTVVHKCKEVYMQSMIQAC